MGADLGVGTVLGAVCSGKGGSLGTDLESYGYVTLKKKPRIFIRCAFYFVCVSTISMAIC